MLIEFFAGRLSFQRQMLTGVEIIRQALIQEYCHWDTTRTDILKVFMVLYRTQLEAYNILKDEQENTENSEWAKLLKRIMEESDMIFLHRLAEDPFEIRQLQQLRCIYSCLTSEPEIERFGYTEDPEIMNFQLSQNHIPPLTQIIVKRLV